MKKIGLLFLTTMLFALGSCSEEDDVNEIFADGQTWHWSGSYDTSNWKDDNKYTSTLKEEDLKQINSEAKKDAFILLFEDNGNVSGKGESFSFSGTWSANGKDNSISINIKENATLNAGSRDATFLKEIKEAKFYRGDSKFIKLFDAAKKHYIQFYPLGFRN